MGVPDVLLAIGAVLRNGVNETLKKYEHNTKDGRKNSGQNKEKNTMQSRDGNITHKNRPKHSVGGYYGYWEEILPDKNSLIFMKWRKVSATTVANI